MPPQAVTAAVPTGRWTPCRWCRMPRSVFRTSRWMRTARSAMPCRREPSRSGWRYADLQPGAGTPTWLTINSATGQISGLPPANATGDVTVTVLHRSGRTVGFRHVHPDHCAGERPPVVTSTPGGLAENAAAGDRVAATLTSRMSTRIRATLRWCWWTMPEGTLHAVGQRHRVCQSAAVGLRAGGQP